MAHMVIFQRADGTAGYHQCDELNEAVQYVETIRNNDGVEHARIFRMEEVSFDFKPYFRVELGSPAVATAPPVAAPAPAAEVEESSLPEPPVVPDPTAPLVAPDEVASPFDGDSESAGAGPRRGLFGR